MFNKNVELDVHKKDENEKMYVSLCVCSKSNRLIYRAAKNYLLVPCLLF